MACDTCGTERGSDGSGYSLGHLPESKVGELLLCMNKTLAKAQPLKMSASCSLDVQWPPLFSIDLEPYSPITAYIHGL